MKLIWATRGKDWGFRFLRDGGFPNPLSEYAQAFAGIEHEREACRRLDDKVALRFPDPLGRQDASGRVIHHEFVAYGALAARVNSVEEGLQEVWPLVEEEYARAWASPSPRVEQGDK